MISIKPDFDIVNEDPAAEDAGQCRLLLEVGSCSLIFVLLNVRGMRPVAVRVYNWDPIKNQDAELILRSILDEDSILSQFQPNEIFLTYNFPESSLVPEKFYGTDMARPVTELIYGDLSQDLVLEEKIPWFEFHNVYRVPPRIHFLMQEKFPTARFWHFYSLQLKCYKMFTAKEETAFLKVFFYPDKMIVLASKRGQLQLIQHFSYQHSKDALYHLVNCSHQLDMNRQELVLELSGLIEKKSALYEDLELYFLNIRFDSMEDSIKMTDGLIQYPGHFFSSLLKMTICV